MVLKRVDEKLKTPLNKSNVEGRVKLFCINCKVTEDEITRARRGEIWHPRGEYYYCHNCWLELNGVVDEIDRY